jgi:hypothetical protein
MGDQKLSQQSLTADPTGYFYQSKPNGLGGREDYQISDVSLLADIWTAITDIEAQINVTLIVDKNTNKSADFTFDIPANAKLEAIDYRGVSGTTSVKVGTTPAGTEILSNRTVTTSNDSNNYIGKTFINPTTLYITITGGTINVNFAYRENYF